MASPTSRSLTFLRKEGYLCDIVERWIIGANIRKDLFGFGDLLAVHRLDRSITIIQTTTLSNLSARIKKAKSLASLKVWLQSGGKVEFHGWAKDSDGKWIVRRVSVEGDELISSELTPARRRKSRKPEPSLFDIQKE